MIYQGVRGLLFYDEEKKIWGQAHIWAAWVIFQAIREGDPQLIQLEFKTKEDGKNF